MAEKKYKGFDDSTYEEDMKRITKEYKNNKEEVEDDFFDYLKRIEKEKNKEVMRELKKYQGKI